jgi:hypothetical protein
MGGRAGERGRAGGRKLQSLVGECVCGSGRFHPARSKQPSSKQPSAMSACQLGHTAQFQTSARKKSTHGTLLILARAIVCRMPATGHQAEHEFPHLSINQPAN